MQQYTSESLQAQLLSLQDLKYQKFHSSLLPGVENIIGVRMPALRNLAKEVLRTDWQNYLETSLPEASTYYEEDIIQALLIGTGKISWQERHAYIHAFVPKINNWAVCDLFCSTLKEAQKYPQEYWQLLLPYFSSTNAYALRFGAVMLLNHFTSDTYAKEALNLLHNVKHEDYYVKMAVAWAISIFYVKQPQLTLPLLQENHLDNFTHNKSIQKIRESFRVSDADKEMLNKLKRK
ncbi:MAG: DNA alkylation repair protein [Phascolarctobacterium sp.]|nr:DNA alkylation repair protein [Phascolarctobacterium sp.]